jgi:hypothetical protein
MLDCKTTPLEAGARVGRAAYRAALPRLVPISVGSGVRDADTNAMPVEARIARQATVARAASTERTLTPAFPRLRVRNGCVTSDVRCHVEVRPGPRHAAPTATRTGGSQPMSQIGAQLSWRIAWRTVAVRRSHPGSTRPGTRCLCRTGTGDATGEDVNPPLETPPRPAGCCMRAHVQPTRSSQASCCGSRHRALG